MNKLKAIFLATLALWVLPLLLLSTPFVGGYAFLSAAIRDIRDQWAGRKQVI